MASIAFDAESREIRRRARDANRDFQVPLWKVMVAGGTGGVSGDLLMHSLDTVKTRQQAAQNRGQYSSFKGGYVTILRQEGLFRGLYSGFKPALAASVPGTVAFFGIYESTKRFLLSTGLPETPCYLTSGFMADLCVSVLYVPSEVLKTRLQLQGRFNNPYFASGYNYRGTLHAIRTIRNLEGTRALFNGYWATLCRDLPFSAIEFAFYGMQWFRVVLTISRKVEKFCD
jgi:hypothetical protein